MYRVRIKKAPREVGSWQLPVASERRDDRWQMTDDSGMMKEGGAVGMKNMLGAVDRGQANIEAERGESVMGDFDQDGGLEHMAVGGRPHSEGGTPLQVPDGSFVFSNTRKLKMGGPMLAEFGKSATTKKKYTPAELAKQYDLNRYKEILEDPDSDQIAVKSAAAGLEFSKKKLAKLALYQEAKKGFPQGIPQIAMPLLQGMLGGGGNDDRGQMTDDSGGMAGGFPGGGAPVAGYADGNQGGPPGGGQLPTGDFADGSQEEQGMQMGKMGGIMRARAGVGGMMLPRAQVGGFNFSYEPTPVQQPWVLPMGSSNFLLQRQQAAAVPSMQMTRVSPATILQQLQGTRPAMQMTRVSPTSHFVAPSQRPLIGRFNPPYEPTPVQQPWILPQGTPNIIPPRPQRPGEVMQTEQLYPAAYMNAAAVAPQGPGAVQQGPTVAQQGPGSRNRPLYDHEFVPSDGEVIYPGYLPSSHQSNVPWVQQRRKDGLYGNQNWDMNDFYKRHPWVQKERPNFDPANADDVDWFQHAYNTRYHEQSGRDYFDGKGHLQFDKKFGQGTFSTPSVVETERYLKPLPFTKTAANPYSINVDAKSDPTTLDVPGKEKEKQKQSESDWTPWWTQDKINLGAAYRNRYDLHKYMPTYVSPDLYLPNAVYYDPTRNLAENQGMMALQNMMNMTYAGPQRLRAVGSNVYGQGYGQAANALGDFANRNVAVANQSAITKAGSIGNYNLQKAASLDTFLKGNTIANQQWDNSVRFLDNDIRKNLVSGITNQQKTSWMNQLNPYFSIHPDAFGSKQFFFKGGKGLGSPASGGTGQDPWGTYQSYYDQYMAKVPGADRKSANEFALRQAFSNKSQYGVDSDGDVRASTSGYNNAQAAAYLAQYGPQFGG
jgi:hypothetical protein